MKTIYVDVTTKLALKVDEDADYDAIAGDLEEKITVAVGSVTTTEAIIEVLEGAMLTVTDSK